VTFDAAFEKLARANVANGKVRPFTQTRLCLDYEI